MLMKKILMLMPYFGKWPEWMNLFIESCKYNPTIDWIFFTDCGRPENKAKNVKYVKMGLKMFNKLASIRLGISIDIKSNFKLCDFRPTYGKIFEDYLNGYDYWGWGDIDLIYGDLRRFFNEKIMKYDIISTSPTIISGPLSLLKNSPEIINLYSSIKDWKGKLKNKECIIFDENYFSAFILKKEAYSFTSKDYKLGNLGRRIIYYSPSFYKIIKKLKILLSSFKNNFKANSNLSLPKIIEGKYCFMNTYATPYV